MTRLYLLEPEDPGLAWAPFTGVRPIAELRAGAWRIRERWEAVIGTEAVGIIGPHVEGFVEDGVPPVVPATSVVGPAIVAASWFAPEGTPVPGLDEATALVHDGQVVAWRIAPGARWEGPRQAGGGVEIAGLPLLGTYDLLTALEHLLVSDCADFLTHAGDELPSGSIVLGDPAEIVSLGAAIEAGVVFDVRHGAVVLEEGVEVRSGTRLEGPVYAGPGTRILGGFIRQAVFGPECRVRGEISTSVFLGYGNKAHDGFVGHSVLGVWTNLGAGTTTSNLKNTYGEVRLAFAGRQVDTGRINVGSLIGDHAKTAIGTLLSTGTVIGAGANVFGTVMPPKYLPPFAWGCEAAGRLDEERFLLIAERVLPRRNVQMTDAIRASLRAIYRRAVQS